MYKSICWYASTLTVRILAIYQYLTCPLDSFQDVFCDEDGEREFTKSAVCPACESELPGKLDIVRVDLQPSEEYKSVGSRMYTRKTCLSIDHFPDKNR